MPLDHNDLREMKKYGDVEGLLATLETGEIKEKRDAICILGEMRSRKATRHLIGLLEKDDVQLRANAAWALGEIGDARAVLPLVGLLNDPSENVQIHAAWSLGRIGDKRAVSGLKSALKNSSPELRKHAKEAIDRIEKKRDDEDYEENDMVDIPLVTVDFPQDIFGCKLHRVEGKNNGDVVIKDSSIRENTRRVILGLKKEFGGLVSIDILFRYEDNGKGENTWLQLRTAEGSYTTRAKNEPVTREYTEEKIQEIKKPQTAAIPEKTAANVDSAVKLLSDIGMTGMTKAASAVTQLAGHEEESLQSQLRTIPADQIHDEIAGMGDSIVLIGVKLHGKGQEEMSGEMHLYLSKDNALEIANELLCIPPDEAYKEFTQDIVSTLKETTNISGGQYISAVSEYIGVPILLDAPSFKTGSSLQIAESVMKDVAGKIEFALATDIALGSNRSGRLVLLLDPKSYEIILAKGW